MDQSVLFNHAALVPDHRDHRINRSGHHCQPGPYQRFLYPHQRSHLAEFLAKNKNQLPYQHQGADVYFIIKLDAYSGQDFNGYISKIGFQSETTSGGGTAFNTEIALPDNTNNRFKVGMNGDMDIIIDKSISIRIIIRRKCRKKINPEAKKTCEDYRKHEQKLD